MMFSNTLPVKGGSQVSVYVLQGIDVSVEYSLLEQVFGMRPTRDYVEDGFRVYEFGEDFKVYSDGYGCFWVKRFKDYDNYLNVSSSVYNSVVDRIALIVRNYSNGVVDVVVRSVSGHGVVHEEGTRYIKTNNTLVEQPLSSNIVYSVRIELKYIINNYTLLTNPYIVVDYEGDIVDGGFIIPFIQEVEELSSIPDQSSVYDELYNHVKQFYGKPVEFETTSLGYVYLSPTIHRSSKPYIAPGYMSKAIVSGKKIYSYIAFTEDREYLFDAESSSIPSSSINNYKSNPQLYIATVGVIAIIVSTTTVIVYRSLKTRSYRR